MEEIIKESNLYKSIIAEKANIELWDDNYEEDGWVYYSIVSNDSGVVRKLEYVRTKDNKIQKRIYDENGDDLWVLVE